MLHPIWQREWTFDRREEFENALGQFALGLLVEPSVVLSVA
jgi:hypothetical protein